MVEERLLHTSGSEIGCRLEIILFRHQFRHQLSHAFPGPSNLPHESDTPLRTFASGQQLVGYRLWSYVEHLSIQLINTDMFILVIISGFGPRRQSGLDIGRSKKYMEPCYIQVQLHSLIDLFDPLLVDTICKVGTVVQPHCNTCDRVVWNQNWNGLLTCLTVILCQTLSGHHFANPLLAVYL